MAAATRLIAERGFGAVTLDDIAAAAGVTKPIVYRHFRSKDELHLALLARHRDALLETLSTGLAERAPLEARVPAVAAAWLTFVDDHPYAARMLFRDTTGAPEFERFHEEMRATARGALAHLIRSERSLRVPEEHVETLAELLRAGMAGLALWRAGLDDPPARAAAAAAAAALFWTGLRGYASASA